MHIHIDRQTLWIPFTRSRISNIKTFLLINSYYRHFHLKKVHLCFVFNFLNLTNTFQRNCCCLSSASSRDFIYLYVISDFILLFYYETFLFSFFFFSLGGNAKTLMFVNTSPADYNNAESNSSLSFASRCKDITNAVASNGSGVQVWYDEKIGKLGQIVGDYLWIFKMPLLIPYLDRRTTKDRKKNEGREGKDKMGGNGMVYYKKTHREEIE